MISNKQVTVAPNGMIYVKAEIRRGLLGRMLTELLDTRIMVKEALKASKDNKVRFSSHFNTLSPNSREGATEDFRCSPA